MSYCGCSGEIHGESNYIFFKKNDAIAYSCKYTKENTCNKDEARAAFDLIAGNCGSQAAPHGGW